MKFNRILSDITEDALIELAKEQGAKPPTVLTKVSEWGELDLYFFFHIRM